MKYAPALFLVLLLTLLSGCGFGGMPTSTYTTSKAKVLKVYSATDAGHNFIAYVVDRGGTEVIVSDALGRSSYKVGDSIEYLDQKIEFKGKSKSMSFSLLK